MHILLNESKDGVKSCSCLRCKTDELEGLEGTGAVPVHKGSRLMQRGCVEKSTSRRLQTHPGCSGWGEFQGEFQGEFWLKIVTKNVEQDNNKGLAIARMVRNSGSANERARHRSASRSRICGDGGC